MSVSVPPGTPGEAPEAEERVFGHSGRAQSASRLLVALARAARSFLLYDSSNEAIRQFLASLQDAANDYFGTHGTLVLEVRPFELLQDGEVLYLDRDRERSLAFRLFRDGVRRLTLAPGVNFHELLKFLEIISIRYTGVRSTEDDMVVLLWKAGFQFLEVEAVEGLVADDDAEADAVSRAHAGTFGGVPEDFDLPPPEFAGEATLRWAALPEEALAGFHHEDSTAQVPELCIRLIEELAIAVTGEGNRIPWSDAVPSLRELRDFLLGDGTIQPLLAAVRLLRDLPLVDPTEAESRDVLLASFVDTTSLARLLRSVPRDALAAGPEIIEFLSMLPGDHLRTLLSVITVEKGDASRRAARSIIETYVSSQLPWMLDKMAHAEPPVAAELLRAIAHAGIEPGLLAAERVAARPDIEIQFEILHLLGRASVGPVVGRLLGVLCGSPHETIRLRALELVRDRAVMGAFRPMAEYVKRAAIGRLDAAEAQAFGEAMARADPLGAMALFRDWCKPPGMFSVVLPQHIRLHYVAVAGLALMAGEDAERLITSVKGKADNDLQRFIVAAMIRRRRVGRGVGV